MFTEMFEIGNFRLIEIENERRSVVDEKSTLKTQLGTNTLIQCIPTGTTHTVSIIKLCSQVLEDQEAPPVFILPGIEGVFKPLDPLVKQLKAHVFGVQYNYNNPEDTIQGIALNILPVRFSFKANFVTCV